MQDVRDRLAAARLYLICDERPGSFLHAALGGGVDVVQLRMKNRSDAEVLETAERFASVCREHGALFILNDRPDLAAAACADGVHVGQDDLSVGRARELVGAGRLVGVSTHTPEQVDAAAQAGADYIGVGPVYRTPTKPGRAPVGIELVQYAAATEQVPFFAIGGVDVVGAEMVRRAGARRIAVVRALTDAPDPRGAARSLRAIMEPSAETEEIEVGPA